MKKDKMLGQLLAMRDQLTRYELREENESLKSAIAEKDNWLNEFRQRDNRQLEKMVEQQEEINRLKVRLVEVESERDAKQKIREGLEVNLRREDEEVKKTRAELSDVKLQKERCLDVIAMLERSRLGWMRRCAFFEEFHASCGQSMRGMEEPREEKGLPAWMFKREDIAAKKQACMDGDYVSKKDWWL